MHLRDNDDLHCCHHLGGSGAQRFPVIAVTVRTALAAFALAVLCCASQAGQAVVRDYYFDRAGGDQGLAQNTVTAMVQDADGFVWVGTQGGLHRFDGQRYTLYQHDPDDPGSLPDSFITALARDDAGALWVGSYSQYVARLDPRTGKLHRYRAGMAGDQAGSHDGSDHVHALLAHAGIVWVGTSHGLERLDPGSGQRRRALSLSPSTLADQPQALLRDPRGSLWYATAAGLYRLDDASPTPVRVGLETGLRSLLRDRSGRLWAGGLDGLFLLQDRNTLLRVWPKTGHGEAGRRSAGASDATRIDALVDAPDGRLWFTAGTDGIRRYDPRNGDSIALHENPGIPGSLPEDRINTLLVDTAGLLWVGGQYHGVAVADSRGTRFQYLTDQMRHGQQRPALDSSIRAVFQDRQQRLWMGTDDGRLLRYDGTSGFQDASDLLPVTADSRTGQRVMAFADPGDGRPWVATTIGLFRLDPALPALQPIPIPGIPAPNLRSLAIGADGRLWLGSNDAGVIGFQPANGAVQRLPARGAGPPAAAPNEGAEKLARLQVHALLVARDGRVWIGTSHGLDLFDPRRNSLRHFRTRSEDSDSLGGDLVRALWQDHDGSIWVGSHGGLDHVVADPQGNFHFTHPLRKLLQHAFTPVVFSLAGDDDGSLWLGSNRGLMRYTPPRAPQGVGRLRSYGLADGLQDMEFNGGAAAVLDGGKLAFGGVSGVNIFDPSRIHDSTQQPPLRLLSSQAGASAGPAWTNDKVVLRESDGLLRLRIGALEYLDNAAVRYRYRIDGLNDDWVDNGHGGEITYTWLPAGHYRFRAQGTNHDGVWNPHELQLPIIVTPPAWRSWPAYLAYALLLAGAAWATWRYWHGRRRLEREFVDRIRDREDRLKLALWASEEEFWDYDLSNGEMRRMHVGDNVRSADDIYLETEVEALHPIHADDVPLVRERVIQHLRGDSPLFVSEHRIPDKDGQWIWVRARGRVVEHQADGRARRMAGIARNVTRSRHADRERRIAAEILRSMSEAVSVTDLDFNFISVNPAFTQITGYSDTEVLGRSASLLDSSQHDPEFYIALRSELERVGHWSGEMWQQRKDGEEFLCAIESSAVMDSNGRRSLYVAVLNDITDQKRAEQELRYLANYDTLTNLPNRTLLAERLSRAIVRARRQDDRIGVLFLDLDRFKDINDSLGHAAGDRILRAAAVRLQDTVGPQHTVARLSGDEFTILLENLASPEQADKTAREIITAFEAPLQLDERHEISISPSIGISLYPDNAQVPTELLKQADTAMYQAKAAGRRTYMRYNEDMDVSIRHRATVTGALRKVLDRNELRLVYQPRMALSPEPRIIGVEALLRWHSAEHGDIEPAEFIPLAEESGLILEIGEWVLREACLTLGRWRQHGLEDLRMSVNVSALQLLRGDLPGVVERVLEESSLPPRLLELELTESVVMANAKQTADKLRAFRDLGVTLAIDDFGTGYSSLAYLKRLPIHTLKIDKEFVDDLSQGSEDAAITTTIIAMARSLGLNVVAEGVETQAQVDFLRTHDCDEIQGFWLSSPLEAQRCLAFIRNWAPQPKATRPAGARPPAAP